jgi:hypothetical protein
MELGTREDGYGYQEKNLVYYTKRMKSDIRRHEVGYEGKMELDMRRRRC